MTLGTLSQCQFDIYFEYHREFVCFYYLFGNENKRNVKHFTVSQQKE